MQLNQSNNVIIQFKLFHISLILLTLSCHLEETFSITNKKIVF